MVRRLLTLAAAVLLLTGCEAKPFYGPSPTPTMRPFFANEQEALDAVEAFMAEYMRAANTLLLSGGSDQSALAPLVSPAQLKDDVDAAVEIKAANEQFVGELAYFGLEIQQFDQDNSTEAFVQAYVCLDYRQSEYLQPDGTTFKGERDWAPFEAIMTANAERSIILEELRFWTGRDFCEQRS